ncbi:hypothetical protein, partial [Streptomyces viridochromogenes]|uniref:hypothetical protein n=1 Tax=Streptomyces viridochromogenes TaxID=1938 RepID=UPI001C4E9291
MDGDDALGDGDGVAELAVGFGRLGSVAGDRGPQHLTAVGVERPHGVAVVVLVAHGAVVGAVDEDAA